MKNQPQSLPGFQHLHHGELVSTDQDAECQIYRREAFGCDAVLQSRRRAFFKIALVVGGTGRLYYADRGIDIAECSLVFSNPSTPYAWEPASPQQTGYFCAFTEAFLAKKRTNATILKSSAFQPGGCPVYLPTEEQMQPLCYFFEQMLREKASDYRGKYEVLQNYIELVIHEAEKIRPANNFFTHSASSRICSLFLELLERKFSQQLPVQKPSDFARYLNIHVNHLNRSVKEVTGKTTTALIAERTLREAKTLLLQTDHNVAAMAYQLGFNHPSNFNIFFKKHTGATPTEFRQHC